MRVRLTRAEQQEQTRERVVEAADRCSSSTASTPRRSTGRGRGRLHEGRGVLELRVQGGPVLRRLRAPRRARRSPRWSAGSPTPTTRARGGSTRCRCARRAAAARDGRLAGGVLRVLGARRAPPGAARALRGDPHARAGAVRRGARALRGRARHVLPDDPRKLTVALLRDAARAVARAADRSPSSWTSELGAADGPVVPRRVDAESEPMMLSTIKRLADFAAGSAAVAALAERERWPRERLERYQQRAPRCARAPCRAALAVLSRAAGRGRPVELAGCPTLDKATMMDRFDDIVTDPRLRRDELLAHVERARPATRCTSAATAR